MVICEEPRSRTPPNVTGSGLVPGTGAGILGQVEVWIRLPILPPVPVKRVILALGGLV